MTTEIIVNKKEENQNGFKVWFEDHKPALKSLARDGAVFAIGALVFAGALAIGNLLPGDNDDKDESNNEASEDSESSNDDVEVVDVE